MVFIVLCGSYFNEYEEVFKKYLPLNVKVVNIESINDPASFIEKDSEKILFIIFTDKYKNVLEKKGNLVNIIVKKGVPSIFLNSIMNLHSSLKKLFSMDFKYFICNHNIDRNFGEYNLPLNGGKIPIPYFGYFKEKSAVFTQKIDIVHADPDRILSFIINQRIFVSSLHIPILLLIYMPYFISSIMKQIFDKLGLEILQFTGAEGLIFQLDELIFNDIQKGSILSLAYIMTKILSSFIKKEYMVRFEKRYGSSIEKLCDLNVLSKIDENEEILVKLNESMCNRIIKMVERGRGFKTLGFVVKGAMEE